MIKSKTILFYCAFLLALLLLSACAPPPANTTGVMEPKEFMLGSIQFLLYGINCVFLLVINPARQRQEEREKFIAGLKKNDEVITTGGIIGRVASIKNKQVSLEIAPNVRVRVATESVRPLKKGVNKSGNVVSAKSEDGELDAAEGGAISSNALAKSKSGKKKKTWLSTVVNLQN